MSDIFVSYSTEDRLRAQRLAAALEGCGWSVFWDRTIPTGSTWRETIGRALDDARCVIVLWSKASIESGWVQEEADDAKRRGILIPVRIDNIRIPIGFRSIQAADLLDWDGSQSTQAFGRLIVDIARLIGSPPKQADEAASEHEPDRREPAAQEAIRAPKAPVTPAKKPGSRGWDEKRKSGALIGSAPWRYIAGGAVLLAILALLVWRPWSGSSPAEGEEADLQPNPPAQQEPSSITELSMRMGNEALVRSAVIRATDVLAAAEKSPNFFTDGCDQDAKVRDFYRGMLLAHAGYFLVITDLRTGSYRDYGFLPEGYSALRKASLYAYWTMDRVTNVWRTPAFLSELADDDRRAIAVFLNELRSYRAIYAQVKRVRPNLATMNWSRGPPISIDEINEIWRQAGHAPIGRCYMDDYGYKLSWNVTARGHTEISFEPAAYMFGFWYRRDVEGKSDLADWFLTSMVGWLKS